MATSARPETHPSPHEPGLSCRFEASFLGEDPPDRKLGKRSLSDQGKIQGLLLFIELVVVVSEEYGETCLRIVINGQYPLPRRARASARLNALVLFPTPPFRLAIAITVAIIFWFLTSMVRVTPWLSKGLIPIF